MLNGDVDGEHGLDQHAVGMLMPCCCHVVCMGMLAQYRFLQLHLKLEQQLPAIGSNWHDDIQV